MNKKYTISNFNAEYATNEDCLHKIYTIRYKDLKTCPKCGLAANYKKVATRMCYYCPECYNQIHPMAGTIFEKSTTPLTDWFYAMYLFSQSKNGLSACELQRHIDVTYKTAWRMLMKIRSILETEIEFVKGVFELDETYIGGLAKNMHYHKRKKYTGTGALNKIAVFGMLNRETGVRVKVMQTNYVSGIMLKPIIFNNIEKGVRIITDGHGAYKDLNLVYTHDVVSHDKGEYVRGDIHTNGIENYWSNIKRMLKGSHISVSTKYLQNYINEASYKYNNRHQKSLFNDILSKI